MSLSQTLAVSQPSPLRTLATAACLMSRRHSLYLCILECSIKQCSISARPCGVVNNKWCSAWPELHTSTLNSSSMSYGCLLKALAFVIHMLGCYTRILLCKIVLLSIRHLRNDCLFDSLDISLLNWLGKQVLRNHQPLSYYQHDVRIVGMVLHGRSVIDNLLIQIACSQLHMKQEATVISDQ